MNKFGDKVSFIWSVADLIRDSFKRSKYPDVILPLTVLRRLDCDRKMALMVVPECACGFDKGVG